MKNFLPIFTRLLLVGSIAGIGYIYVAKPQNLPVPIQNLVNQSSTKVDSVLAAVNHNQLLNKAGEKLTKPQPIISDSSDSSLNQSPEVKGDSTSQFTDEAKKAIGSTVSQVSDQLQSLPKKEAAKILRQTCEQIATDLEK